MTIPDSLPGHAGPLRDFPDAKHVPIPPESVRWNGRNSHLRMTYEALYALGPSRHFRGVRALAESVDRPRSTVHCHADALVMMGLLEVEPGYGGLEDYEASVYQLACHRTVSLADAEVAPRSMLPQEPSGTNPSGPGTSGPGTTGQWSNTPIPSTGSTRFPVEDLPEVVTLVSRRARSYHPDTLRADEQRWQRTELTPGALRIAREWLARGKPVFSAPEMAAWAHLDRRTVTRRLQAIKASDSRRTGATAAYDERARRWTLDVKAAVSTNEWDALMEIATSGTDEERRVASALLGQIVLGYRKDRAAQHAFERLAHRSTTREDWARRNGNSTDWIKPADPANGRRFRGVKRSGMVEVKIDDHGWPKTVLVPDPDLVWVDEPTEITLTSGARLTQMVPRRVRKALAPEGSLGNSEAITCLGNSEAVGEGIDSQTGSRVAPAATL